MKWKSSKPSQIPFLAENSCWLLKLEMEHQPVIATFWFNWVTCLQQKTEKSCYPWNKNRSFYILLLSLALRVMGKGWEVVMRGSHKDRIVHQYWKMTWRGLCIEVLGPSAYQGIRVPDLLPLHLSKSTPARTLGKSHHWPGFLSPALAGRLVNFILLHISLCEPLSPALPDTNMQGSLAGANSHRKLQA